jgi:hypothetical protein
MGICDSKEQREIQQKNNVIDSQIKRKQIEMLTEVKMLLLGKENMLL